MTDEHRHIKRASTCLLLWKAALVLMAAGYISFYVRFDRKVRFFENDLQLGTTESEAIDELGSPSFLWLDTGDVHLLPAGEGRKYDVLVYSGLNYFRDNLYLYFDSISRRLVHKKRGMHAPGWRW